jgi:hypothetical protein
MAMKTLLSHISRGRTAPIQDHMKGRNSEIAFISGVVSSKGKELGIPTPANDVVVELDRQINQGLLKMDPSNFELLKKKLGAGPARRLPEFEPKLSGQLLRTPRTSTFLRFS